MVKKVKKNFKWSLGTTEHKNKDKICDNKANTSENQNILDKTLFIDGCDCGVIVDSTIKPEKDLCGGHNVIELKYNNSSKCLFEYGSAEDEEVQYKDDCFVETSNGSSNSDTNHVYASLERSTEQYSTINDEYFLNDHVYEIVI